MHHLQRGTQDSTTKIAVRREDAASEAVPPADEVSALGNGLQLVFIVGDDFGKFLTDVLGVHRLATDTGQNLCSLFKPALLDEVTRRFRQHKQPATQDESPEHLKSNWDAVGAGVIAVLGTVVDAGSRHETNCDAELVSRDDGSTDFARRNLRHVQNDDGRDETNTEACNQTASHDQTEPSRGSLKNDTDDEDSAASDDGGATAKPICKITGNQGTEEGTGRQDGGDQGLLPGGNDELLGRSSGWILGDG